MGKRYRPKKVEPKPEEEDDEEEPYLETFKFDQYLGKCNAVYESLVHESRFIVTGSSGFAIVED